MPGSHNYHSSFTRSHAKNDIDFVRVPSNSPSLPKELCNRLRLVTASAGDLILWDSRTIHANTPAISEIHDKKTSQYWCDELLQIASYVCMVPKYLASDGVLKSGTKLIRKRSRQVIGLTICQILARVVTNIVRTSPLETYCPMRSRG